VVLRDPRCAPQFGKQPRILHRDDRLVGKGADQLDLPLSERLDPFPREIDGAEHGLLAQERHLTSLREKLIKIGAKIVSHGRYVTFQMAEVAVSRQMLADILMLIARLRVPPAPA
jgi:hypothetical protein